MRKRYLYPLLFLFALSEQAYGQLAVSAESAILTGAGKNSPFWLISNQQGLLSTHKNQGYLRLDGQYRYRINTHADVTVGIDAVGAVHSDRSVYLHQAYLEARYRSLTITVGSKESYAGLLDSRLSSGDLVHSTNAAPIPEVNLAMRHFQPIPLTKGWLQVKGDLAVGRSFDGRYLEKKLHTTLPYVKNTLWHHKSLYLRIGNRSKIPVQLTAGLQHWAQWGGTSTDPMIGKQPSGLKDLWKVFCGQEGGEKATWADMTNVLGNHYGSYDLMISYDSYPIQLSAYHQHYFEDKGGMEWSNGLDGLWGGTITLPRWRNIHKILFEYLTTRNQSGPLHFIDFDHTRHPGRGGGCDNYYNNGEYATGVSYYQHTLGNPFLINPAYTQTLGFSHNRIRTYHVALDGKLSPTVSYTVHVSHTTSWGRMEWPIVEPVHLTAIGLGFQYELRKNPAWQLEASTGYDVGQLIGDSWGMELRIRWRLPK